MKNKDNQEYLAPSARFLHEQLASIKHLVALNGEALVAASGPGRRTDTQRAHDTASSSTPTGPHSRPRPTRDELKVNIAESPPRRAYRLPGRDLTREKLIQSVYASLDAGGFPTDTELQSLQCIHMGGQGDLLARLKEAALSLLVAEQVLPLSILNALLASQGYTTITNEAIEKARQKRAALEAQRERSRQADSLRAALKTRFSCLKSALTGLGKAATMMTIPTLDTDDIRLSALWLQEPVRSRFKDSLESSVSPLQSLESEYRDNKELGRVLSARAAERIAQCIYAKFGLIARDVSQLQLTQPWAGDWRQFDVLLTDHTGANRAIDVKNARYSQGRSTHVLELCVPTYKATRRLGDVTVVGVISPYLWPETLMWPERASWGCDLSCYFVGEVNPANHRRLIEHFHRDGEFELVNSLVDLNRGLMLPTWMFDYPASFYKDVNSALKLLIDALADMERADAAQIEPGGLILRAEGEGKPRFESLSNWETRFAQSLFGNFSKLARTMPVILLTVLTDFIDACKTGRQEADYSPRDYSRFLWGVVRINSEVLNFDRAFPLAVVDLREHIFGLVQALEQLWNSQIRYQLGRFRQYRLRAHGILQARSLDSKPWQTLVAYCGGEEAEGRKCSNWPLIMGRHLLCPECNHLICDQCGFCSHACDRGINSRCR